MSAYAVPRVRRCPPIDVISVTDMCRPRDLTTNHLALSSRPMIAVDTDRLTASLPAGYRARPFEDRDREPWVAERNTWYGPMEQSSAEEWRTWERMAPDETRLRITVDDPSGKVAAIADVGAGGSF